MRRRLAVIGQPIGHSLSPAIQRAAIEHYGLNLTYDPIDVGTSELSSFVKQLTAPTWLGVNVTAPHKESIIAMLSRLTDIAGRVGAVNTVVVSERGTDGHNTDVAGFLQALKIDGAFDPAAARTVVLGAGGAARACCVALLDSRVASLTILNRDVQRAARLAESIDPNGRVTAGSIAANRDTIDDADLIVNSTTVGMSGGPAPEECPFPAEWLPRNALVYDLVYRPALTPLLRAAAAAGLRVLGGLPMLVYQGAAAFELWTERPAPVVKMTQAAREALEEAATCSDS